MESFRLCLVPIKCKENKKKKKNGRKEKTTKNKNRFKINKLFLHAVPNSFHL